MRPSLNRRVIMRLVAGIALVWIFAVAWMGWRSVREVDEVFDQMLLRTSAGVFAVMPEAPADGRIVRLPHTVSVGADTNHQRPAIVILDAQSQLLLHSAQLPAQAFDPRAPAFNTVTHAERRWRVFQAWNHQRQYWIQVAAPLDERDEMRRKLLAPSLLGLLAMLVLVPPTVFVGVHGGLMPLRRLTQRLSNGTSLTAMLFDEHVPIELAPFTRAVGQCIARLTLELEQGRRFTAAAAHELRPPMATLRLELDLAERCDSAVTCGVHLQRAHHALDRMQRMVTQRLLLAKVEKLTELHDAGPLRLVRVVEAALREISERAAARSVELSLDHEGNDFVEGSEELLGILVQNLLDNALRNTPENGQVNVRVGGTEEHVVLEVNDSGAGFPSADVASLTERLQQAASSVGEGGELGLSIAQAIASLHHGQLAFERSSLGGAQVCLTLRQALKSQHSQREVDGWEDGTPPYGA